MAFGISSPELVIVLAVGFLLFAVPLMALSTALIRRWKRESEDEFRR